jgi:outer membrane receptor protein involved in Fe transport
VSGFEIEGNWRPTDAFDLSFQYSHLSAKVNDAGACIEDTIDPTAVLPGANTTGCVQHSTTAVVQNLKGQQLPEAPPNKFSANALYSWTFDPGKLTLSGTYVWKDVTYGTLFNRPYSRAPSYDEADFRLTWSGTNNNYSVIVFVNNAFDKTGYDGAAGTLLLAPTQPLQPGPITFDPSLIAPRTYGIELQYRFH